MATPETRCVICGCTEDKACQYQVRTAGEVPCSWLIQPGTLPPQKGLGLCDAPDCQHAALMKLVQIQRRPAKMPARGHR